MLVSCGEDSTQPQINEDLIITLSGFSPQKQAIGRTIYIYGEKFGTDKNKIEVLFDKTQARIHFLSDKVIEVKVPTNIAQESNIYIIKDNYRYRVPETFTVSETANNSTILHHFTPKSQSIGKYIVIYGSGFGKIKDDLRVYFDNKKANIINFGDCFIEVQVPYGINHKSVISVKTNGSKFDAIEPFTLISEELEFDSVRVSSKGIIAKSEDESYFDQTINFTVSNYSKHYYKYTFESKFGQTQNEGGYLDLIKRIEFVLDEESQQIKDIEIYWEYDFEYRTPYVFEYENHTRKFEFDDLKYTYKNQKLSISLNQEQFENAINYCYDYHKYQYSSEYTADPPIYIRFEAENSYVLLYGFELNIELFIAQ